MTRYARTFVLIFLFTLFSARTVPSEPPPLIIGFAYVFSDRLAHYGFGARQGAELAIEEINEKGGVLGRKIMGRFADTKLKPDIAVREVTRLIQEDNVDCVMGLVSSAVADAVAPVVHRLRTPLIITLAMTPDVTGIKCNPYTFRISMNGPQNILGAATLAGESGARRWTTMGPDYLFGYQCWEYFQKYLKEKQPSVAFLDKEACYAPVTTDDFTPYIDKLTASKADGVLISLYGGNLIDFVRQAQNRKFFDGSRFVLMNLAYSADVMFALGLDMPKGVWLGGLYWFQANQDSPENKHFVDAYMKKFKLFPDYNAHGGYSGVKAYAAAVAKAGSAQKEKVIKALEGLELDLPVGPVRIRPEDHQAVMDSVWGMTSDFEGKLRCRGLNPVKIFKGADITPPVDKTGCRMPRE